MLDKLLSNTIQVGECLEWCGCFNTDGYPRMFHKGNTNTKVHRLVCELSNEMLIDGLIVRHTCDNSKCINPNHLVLGTMTDNMKDRQERQRTHKFMSQDEVNEIHSLRDKSLTQQYIALELGVNLGRVRYALIKRART